MATKKITLNELRTLVKQIIKEEKTLNETENNIKLLESLSGKRVKLIKEEQLRYNKGQILTLVNKSGNNTGEVTVDTVNNSIIIGYMKSQSTTPIKVKIIQSKNGEGYDVYTEDGTMIRNNHKIAPKN
jgi:uncharacterized phosphosugar-binding protein